MTEKKEVKETKAEVKEKTKYELCITYKIVDEDGDKVKIENKSEGASLEELIRCLDQAPEGHPYKGELEDLRDINEYSRTDSHAAVPGDPAEETSHEELREFGRRVLDLTRGM